MSNLSSSTCLSACMLLDTSVIMLPTEPQLLPLHPKWQVQMGMANQPNCPTAIVDRWCTSKPWSHGARGLGQTATSVGTSLVFLSYNFTYLCRHGISYRFSRQQKPPPVSLALPKVRDNNKGNPSTKENSRRKKAGENRSYLRSQGMQEYSRWSTSIYLILHASESSNTTLKWISKCAGFLLITMRNSIKA